MKYCILFLIIIFTFTFGWAQQNSLPISVEINSSSNGSNSVSELILTPRWSNSLGSSVQIRRIADTTLGTALPSDPKSLLATKYERWEAELIPLKIAISIGDGNSAGLEMGLSWWNEYQLEQGYFAFNGDAQLLANQSKINYFVPAVGLSFDLKFGALRVFEACSFSPAFYYLLDQTIAIQPLVDGQSNQNVDGIGKIIFSNEIRLVANGIFLASWYFDYTKLDFPFLRLGVSDNTPTFYPVSYLSSVINHRIMAGFSLPIGGVTRLVVQVGKNFNISNDLENDITLKNDTFVWQFALSLR
jgi:hypothetical protein